MVWVFAVVVLGSIIYIVWYSGQYREFLEAAQPRIESLERKAGKLEEAVQAAKSRRSEDKERIEAIKTSTVELNRTLITVREQFRKAKEHGEALERKKYKKEYERFRKKMV